MVNTYNNFNKLSELYIMDFLNWHAANSQLNLFSNLLACQLCRQIVYHIVQLWLKNSTYFGNQLIYDLYIGRVA